MNSSPAGSPVLEALRTLRIEAGAIIDCADRLQNNPTATLELERSLQCMRERLDEGGKLLVIGLGKSGKIAQKIAATLSSTGNPAVYLHPTEALHGDLGIVGPADAAIALSYTGNTEEMIRLLPSLKSLRIPIIGVGGRKESQMARLCDFWIDASVSQEACPHGLAPTSSTTLALALGDAIAVALMKARRLDSQAFARNHPGGALGRRLTLTVGDIMHQSPNIACLAQDASMDDVVIASTQKKLGAVLIVEDPTRPSPLLGIITDGDLRRALNHREKFFQLRASEVMTAKPVTARPGMMAQEALELMENRPSQINVLPVIDDRGFWVGILRLHDLVQLI